MNSSRQLAVRFPRKKKEISQAINHQSLSMHVIVPEKTIHYAHIHNLPWFHKNNTPHIHDMNFHDHLSIHSTHNNFHPFPLQSRCCRNNFPSYPTTINYIFSIHIAGIFIPCRIPYTFSLSLDFRPSDQPLTTPAQPPYRVFSLMVCPYSVNSSNQLG